MAVISSSLACWDELKFSSLFIGEEEGKCSYPYENIPYYTELQITLGTKLLAPPFIHYKYIYAKHIYYYVLH